MLDPLVSLLRRVPGLSVFEDEERESAARSVYSCVVLEMKATVSLDKPRDSHRLQTRRGPSRLSQTPSYVLSRMSGGWLSLARKSGSLAPIPVRSFRSTTLVWA